MRTPGAKNWTKPPLGTLIDHAHPLAQELMFYSPLNIGGGNQDFDLRSRLYGALGSGASWGPGGLALNGTASAGVNYGAAHLLDNAAPPMTFGARWLVGSASVGQGTFGSWESALADQQFLLFQSSAEILAAVHTLPGAGNVYLIGTTSGAGITAGQVVTVLMVWVSPTVFIIYVNGKSIGISYSNTGPVPHLSTGDGSAAMKLGNSDANVGTLGTMIWAGIWTRALSQPEAQHLTEEPFAMMQAPTVRRFYSVPAHVTGRLLSLRRRSIAKAA